VTWQSYSSTDSEMHGCIVYDNGWAGVDRDHGHAVYTQNRTGLKTVSDCIFTGGFGASMHAYGEQAYVNNYLFEGNICYDGGVFLIGSKLPSENIRVFENLLYNVGMEVGYSSKESVNAEVRNNLVINKRLAITGFRQVVDQGNLNMRATDPRPAGAQIILRPSKYDPNRANLAILNWERAATVAVDASKFLKNGDTYRLMNPREFYGTPVLAGTFNGAPIVVPMNGEFAPFVMLRDANGR
jgi:hypothetical protein